MAYEICFVITNGQVRKRFFWVTRSSKGFYFAFASKGGGHFSYHADGTAHFVFDSKIKVPEESKRTPIDQIKGVEFFQGISSIVTDSFLDEFKTPVFDDTRFDSIVYIDNRKDAILNAHIYLVEPYKHGEIPIIKSSNTQLYLFTKTTPWLAIITFEQASE